MPKRQVIQEYLATISPSYNIQQWEHTGNEIGGKLQTILGRTLFKGTNEQIQQIEKRIDQLTRKRDLISRSIQQSSQQRDSILSKIQGIEGNEKLSDEEKAQQTAPLREELSKVEKVLGKQREAQKGVVSELNAEQQALSAANGKLSGWTSGISKASGYLAAFVTAVKVAWEAFQKLAEDASEFSNKYVSQNSIFVNTDVRDMMARFGIGNEQAQSMLAASEGLGIDLSDYSRLTQGQREAFDELMRHYQQGLDSIDPDKLDRFNSVVQEYQLAQLKFEMDMQLIWQKMLAESDALPQMLETVSEVLGTITDILGSDAFQTGAEILFGIINGILEFASAPLKLFGGLFGGGSSSSSSTTNNNTTNNNNVTVNAAGISGQQLALDLSMQLQNATTP